MDELKPKRYRLLILRDSTLRTIILEGRKWVVGRAADCDICLDDNTVSRKHLIIERDGDTFRFQDLGGTNQTLVNGRQARTGELPIGSTLLVGLTRLTLDTLACPADVEVIQDPMETGLVFRHYLDADQERSATTQTGGQTEAIACFLERLTTASADFETEEEVAKSYLDALLSHTMHRSGIIARFQGETLKALATVTNRDQPELGIAANLLQEMRARPQAILLTDEKQAERSRILVPLGHAPGGVIMIENPAPSAPPDKECLHLANALAPMIWCRLLETSAKADLRKEVERLRYSRSGANAAVLASTRLLPLRGRLLELAPQNAPLRLLGELGTEGEELARYLHANSPRCEQPFVKFHARGLSPSQLEAGLIGTADPDLETAAHLHSALMQAQGGTLYLEEPRALPLHLQEQLALTIQTGLLDRPGHSKVAIDIRLVINCREIDGVDQGSALCPRLKDLFGPPIRIPPLRDSTEDIFSLAEQYLAEMGAGQDGAPRTFTDSAKIALIGYHWPGNVRELRQALETAATRAGKRPIAPRDLPKLVTQPDPDPRQPCLSTLDEVEKRHITAVLETTQGNRAMAARVLGVATSTLYNKMKHFKMVAPAQTKSLS